jgi:hypothetical protein
MCLWLSYKKNWREKYFFFAPLSHFRKKSDPDASVKGTDPADPDPDPHQKVTDPQS